MRNRKLFPVEISQSTGIGRKVKGQLVGLQRLVIPIEALIQLAVLTVSQQRMPGMGKLGTDLVGSAGDQFAFHQRQPILRSQHLIIGLTGFGARLGRIRYKYPIFLGILEKIPLQTPLFWLGCSLYNGKIPLIQFPILDLLI